MQFSKRFLLIGDGIVFTTFKEYYQFDQLFSKMERLTSKNNMTVVHLAFGASKPVVPFTDQKMTTGKISDPSSVMRSDRYPVPGSPDVRFDSAERDYA